MQIIHQTGWKKKKKKKNVISSHLFQEKKIHPICFSHCTCSIYLINKQQKEMQTSRTALFIFDNRILLIV
jgi:hypothetical protein